MPEYSVGIGNGIDMSLFRDLAKFLIRQRIVGYGIGIIVHVTVCIPDDFASDLGKRTYDHVKL